MSMVLQHGDVHAVKDPPSEQHIDMERRKCMFSWINTAAVLPHSRLFVAFCEDAVISAVGVAGMVFI